MASDECDRRAIFFPNENALRPQARRIFSLPPIPPAGKTKILSHAWKRQKSDNNFRGYVVNPMSLLKGWGVPEESMTPPDFR